MSHPRVPTSFSQCLVLPPLQLPCQKDQPGHSCLTHNCLPPLLALCALKHICTRLIILTGGKNNHMASWQSAFGIHPFDCEYTNILIVLTACIGGRGVCEMVGPVVKWASCYYCHYIHYVNQYACGFSSFLALFVFFVLYFKIFNSLFSICQLCASFNLPIHPKEALKNWSIQCKPVALPTKCSIELLVN